MTDTETPIHLVLGSGGARGLTHIGVIRVLQEQGYAIKSITGCSMGALVGALLVSGHLDEYEEWVCQLTRWDVLRFLDISLLGRSGMVKGDRLLERLSQWLGGVDMESLPIPLTVVAADIASRKEVWISKGDLMDAVRASIAVPGVFSPLVTHGRVLVDGGILNPLPIPPARMDNNTITVAVSLSGRESSHPFGKPILSEPSEVAAKAQAKADAKAQTRAQAQEKAREKTQEKARRKAMKQAEKKTAAKVQTLAADAEQASVDLQVRQGASGEGGEIAQGLASDEVVDNGLEKTAAQKAEQVSETAPEHVPGSPAEPATDEGDLKQNAGVGHQPIESFLDSLQRFFGRDRNGEDANASDAPGSGDRAAIASRTARLKNGSRPALTDVMLGMFNTMQDTIARHQIASNPPDILIDIPCNICESHDFHKAKDLIPAGAYWARRALVDQVDNARR